MSSHLEHVGPSHVKKGLFQLTISLFFFFLMEDHVRQYLQGGLWCHFNLKCIVSKLCFHYSFSKHKSQVSKTLVHYDFAGVCKAHKPQLLANLKIYENDVFVNVRVLSGRVVSLLFTCKQSKQTKILLPLLLDCNAISSLYVTSGDVYMRGKKHTCNLPCIDLSEKPPHESVKLLKPSYDIKKMLVLPWPVFVLIFRFCTIQGVMETLLWCCAFLQNHPLIIFCVLFSLSRQERNRNKQ